MPPKPNKPDAGKKPKGDGKGDKKSKKKKQISEKQLAAERERLLEEQRKAEEAERKRREELERQRAEAEAKRLEYLRISRETELARLRAEESEDMPILAERRRIIRQLREEARRKKEWSQYMSCNPLPNPEIISELNTYISLLREEQLTDVKSTVETCQTAEDVVHSIESILATCIEERDSVKFAQYLAYCQTLRAIIQTKLDYVTAHCDLIQNYEMVEEKGNSHDSVKTDAMACHQTTDFKFVVWINLMDRKQARIKINIRDLGMTVDLPKSLQMQLGRSGTLAFRITYTSFDPFAEQNEGHLQSLGGVFNLQLLEVPPPPSQIKDWSLRELTEASDMAVIRPYISASDQAQGVRLSYQLPRSVLLTSDSLQVAYFDEHEKCWKQDGILDVGKFNAMERIVPFQANRLMPFALVQPKAVDFPYTHWSIKASGPVGVANAKPRAILSLEGLRFTVQLEVVDDEVQFIAPISPALSELQYRPMSPGLLLRKLAACGINLLPSDRDSDFLMMSAKKNELELKTHEMIACLVPFFDVQTSPYNHQAGAAQILLQLRPTTFSSSSSSSSSSTSASASASFSNPLFGAEEKGDRGTDGSWKTVLVNSEKCLMMKAESQRPVTSSNTGGEEKKEGEGVEENKNSELMADPESGAAGDDGAGDDDESKHDEHGQVMQFSEEDFEPSHISIARCVLPLCDDDLKDQLDNPPLKFQETVRRLLNLVRLFSFDGARF
eukprot:TRINITY_DN6689_c0_g1_i1.p1 TRINITY_DN6689_c0_g1~~TRINITY_DN6689_c0_g1_i1.p1  ORF type:complete len:727 (-),score=152.41 TRINITY_DN6689_c0_g1_i1:16-2196(-)